MNFFTKLFSKKEENTQNPALELKKLAFSKLEELKNKEFSEQTFNEFVFIFQVFMEKYLGVGKHLTHEERVKQINAKNIMPQAKTKLIALSSEISQLEFSGKKKDKQILGALIIKFEEILNSI